MRHLVISGILWMLLPATAAEPFPGQLNPYKPAKALEDGVRLNNQIIEHIYLMPEQITKLIFPMPVEEVSVNTLMVQITRNPPTSKEYYLLLSPKVATGRVNMHVVMDGRTYTFELIISPQQVNYRKTYTLGQSSGRRLPKVPPLAPEEIKTVPLIQMIEQARREPNYARIILKDLGNTPVGRVYLWNNAQVALMDAWHYYKQDVVILRVEVHNISNKAIHLSAMQMEPYIGNKRLDVLTAQQGNAILLPGQSDVKYLFLQGYALDIEEASFELKLPPNTEQIQPRIP